jgi:hypothetical protein
VELLLELEGLRENVGIGSLAAAQVVSVKSSNNVPEDLVKRSLSCKLDCQDIDDTVTYIVAA